MYEPRQVSAHCIPLARQQHATGDADVQVSHQGCRSSRGRCISST